MSNIELLNTAVLTPKAAGEMAPMDDGALTVTVAATCACAAVRFDAISSAVNIPATGSHGKCFCTINLKLLC